MPGNCSISLKVLIAEYGLQAQVFILACKSSSMKRIPWYSPAIIRKAMPALVVILFAFMSILFLMRYTDAFFLVLVMWVTMPVFLIKICRKFRDRVNRRE